MGLGIQTGGGEGGDFLPYIKWNAKGGRMYRVDRHNDGNGWITNEEDITDIFKAVVDLEHIEVGWINMNTGGAPDFRMVPLGDDMGSKPSPDHKQGFRTRLKLGKDCGGDVREFSGNAGATVEAMSMLHDAYVNARAENPDQLPVVGMTKTRPVKSQHGTNYAPTFNIVSWAPRPADLKPKTANGNGTSNGATKTSPATGSTKATPPPAAASQTVSAEEFG